MPSDFSITIIGSNSALAAQGRFPTAQYLSFKSKHFLIDCGEGTQFRMNDFKVPKAHIEKIFISHLHGDHFYGLIGLLTSYSLSNRSKPIEIYAPKGLREIIELQSMYSDAHFTYEIIYKETQALRNEVLFEDESICISSFPLKHRIPTTGFLFQEKVTERKLIKEKINSFDLSVDEIIQLKNQQNVVRNDGTMLTVEEFTHPITKARSYAYCSDTAYFEEIVPFIKNANLLYHEATFDKNLIALAQKTNHSTTLEAASIASLAAVKQLMIGHFSSRYKHIEMLMDECKTIFENTIIATEGETFYID